MSLIGARGGVLGAAGGAEAVQPDYWEMTVTTPTDLATWSVQVAAGTTPDLTIVWGDATSDTTANSVTTYDHEYATAGTYTVRISGTFASGGRIRLGKTGNFAYLKAVQPVGGITNLINFRDTMQACTGLTSLPEDLFRWYPNVAADAFFNTFNSCTGLTSLADVPGLFRYNTEVSTNGFQQTFMGCINLTGAIPVDFFRYNTKVIAFGSVFRNTKITSIPTDLFRYCTLVTTFASAFRESSLLETAPALLFKYNTVCTSFAGVFQSCNKLQLRADLFFDTGEASTRFLDKSVNFTDAMSIGTFTGTQGTAPALWDCSFGTGTPTTTACFNGHTTSSITNNGDIDPAWRSD